MHNACSFTLTLLFTSDKWLKFFLLVAIKVEIFLVICFEPTLRLCTAKRNNCNILSTRLLRPQVSSMSSVTRYRCKAATTRAHGCIHRLKRRRSMIRVRIETSCHLCHHYCRRRAARVAATRTGIQCSDAQYALSLPRLRRGARTSHRRFPASWAMLPRYGAVSAWVQVQLGPAIHNASNHQNPGPHANSQD